MVHQLDSLGGRTCIINGSEYLFFSGYDYLGMQSQTKFTTLVKQGIDKYGLVHPSSRISNTQLSLYHEFEEALSLLTGTEDTVTFSSGYLAGYAASQILSGYGSLFKAPFTHPALSLNDDSSASKSFVDWCINVVSLINNNPSDEAKVICLDAVNIFIPTINKISFLEEIQPQQNLVVLIDDSHGIGIIGKEGTGFSSYITKSANVEYLFVYSLSKAFNIIGGAISCSKKFAHQLRALACYSSSTAISPAMAYAFLNSKHLYAEQLQKLKRNITYFFNLVKGGKVLMHPYLPVGVVDYPFIETLLLDKRIVISSFNYPLSSSPKINRVVLNALHTNEDIEAVCSLLLNK